MAEQTLSITEPIIQPLGTQAFAQNSYDNTSNTYDVAIGGQPFILAASDKYPYQRATATYRKQQFDNQPIPGEQSFEGWWLRSQSSWHCGAGIKFLEQYNDNNAYYKFDDSRGLNVWTKGQVTLLNKVNKGHVTTGNIAANGRAFQQARSIKWSTYDGVLLHDEYDVDKVYPTITVSINNKALTSNVATLTTTAAHGLQTGMIIVITGVDSTFNGTYKITGTPSTTTFTYAKTASNVTSTAVSPVGTGTSNVIHFVDYNAGTDAPVYGICDDGVTAYWVTNRVQGGANKIHVFKKALTGDSDTADTTMFYSTGLVATNAVMEYVKERIVMAVNNAIYTFSTTASALPTADYTNPNTNYVYTSITASGAAIYVAGYNGIQSSIYKFTLTSAGAMPTLTSAVVAAEFSPGEIVHAIRYYLGYMIIGTNKGIRIATVSDQDGSINYGPLIHNTEQTVYDFACRDNFVWVASGVGEEQHPGILRIDLSVENEPGRFAWAHDLYDPDVTGKTTTAVAFVGETDKLMFATENYYTYFEDASALVSTGWLQTGFIRYSTVEKKHFKLIKPRVKAQMYGTIALASVRIDGTINPIITLASSMDYNTDISTGVSTPQEELAFRFTFAPEATDTTKGPELNGYQVKSLPAVKRARQLTIPLLNFDFETDRFNLINGYVGRAWDRLTALENIEQAGDTILIQDFTSGETVLGVIENLSFERNTPSNKGYSGFGGVIYLSIRTV